MTSVLSGAPSCRRIISASTPAEQEEHERRDHVHDPDPLVIGRRDPARPAAAARARRAWALICGTGAAWVAMRVASCPRCPRGFRPACAGLGVELGALLPWRPALASAIALLVGQPRFELRRRDGAHAWRSCARGCARTARRTGRCRRPGLRDLEPGVVVVAGDRVELAAELRDPPRVDDVRRSDVERDGRVRSGRPSPRRSRARRGRRVRWRPGSVAPDVLAAVRR